MTAGQQASAAPRRTRPRQTAAETRRQILGSAEALLREHPPRALTIDAVMAGTGHTRTVFYRHFDGIPDLLLAAMQDVGAELYAIAERWAEATERPEWDVEEGLREIVAFWAREGRFMRAVADAARREETVEEVYRGFIEMFTAMTARGFERLQSLGRVAEPLDPHETARALTLLNERYLLDAFGREPAADPERVLATLTGIWRRTVLGRDG